MKKKRGFTLVELIAAITILTVILLIVTPKVIDTINIIKEKAFINSAKRLAKTAESEKLNNLNDNSIMDCSNLAIIDSSNYKNCSISFQDGVALVNIEGDGRYANMKICNATKSNASISYGECNGT